jgi:hypothetical protein
MSKKVLSFSLWGNNKTYTIGAIKNADLALTMYPDFECWFYIHKQTVPKNIIDELQKRKNVKIIFKDGKLNIVKPAMWRFLSIDDKDVYINLSRDTDTRILEREVAAVNEWIESNKTFHIIRDHPHHKQKILAGTFGTKKINNIKSWKKLIDDYKQIPDKQYDQIFLAKYIYPEIKDDVLIHATFNKTEGDICKEFPLDYDDFKHVGEYVYWDDKRSQLHIDILKNEYNKKIYLNNKS